MDMVRRKLGVGVSSFSSPVAHDCPRRLQRALDNLRAIGWSPIEGRCLRTRHGFQSATAPERIRDFTTLLVNPSVDIIMSAIGGYGCLQLVAGLDYLAYKRH